MCPDFHRRVDTNIESSFLWDDTLCLLNEACIFQLFTNPMWPDSLLYIGFLKNTTISDWTLREDDTKQEYCAGK